MKHLRRRPAGLMAMLVALLVGGFVPAAAQDGSSAGRGTNPFAGLGLPEIAVTITNEAFENVPATLSAGRYVLSVTNAFDASNEETSGAAFLQLPPDFSASDFVASMNPPGAEGDGASPPWYGQTWLVGGPYAFLGETAYAVIDLTAGEWVLWGETSGAPQAPVSVTITGDPPADPPTPSADVTVGLSEFAFAFSAPLAAGPRVIEVVNFGEQPHFLFVGGVPDGTTVDDALAAFEAFWNATESPAGGFSFAETPELLGTGDQSAGVTAWYAVDLPSGTVVVACFVTDPESGMAHAMLGMTEIMVLE